MFRVMLAVLLGGRFPLLKQKMSTLKKNFSCARVSCSCVFSDERSSCGEEPCSCILPEQSLSPHEVLVREAYGTSDEQSRRSIRKVAFRMMAGLGTSRHVCACVECAAGRFLDCVVPTTARVTTQVFRLTSEREVDVWHSVLADAFGAPWVCGCGCLGCFADLAVMMMGVDRTIMDEPEYDSMLKRCVEGRGDVLTRTAMVSSARVVEWFTSGGGRGYDPSCFKDAIDLEDDDTCQELRERESEIGEIGRAHV